MNRELLKVMRSLLFEKKQRIGNWPRSLSLCQSTINQLPSLRLRGIAPVTAFMALPQCDPISVFFSISGNTTRRVVYGKTAYAARTHGRIAPYIGKHAYAGAANITQKKWSCTAAYESKSGDDPVDFKIGDFVLSGHVTRRENKLILHCNELYRVVATLHDWIMTSKNWWTIWHHYLASDPTKMLSRKRFGRHWRFERLRRIFVWGIFSPKLFGLPSQYWHPLGGRYWCNGLDWTTRKIARSQQASLRRMYRTYCGSGWLTTLKLLTCALSYNTKFLRREKWWVWYGWGKDWGSFKLGNSVFRNLSVISL